MAYASFQDYLEVKKNCKCKMAVEKPPVEEVPDYHGDTNKAGEEGKEKRKGIKNHQVQERARTFQEYLNAKGSMQDKPGSGMGDDHFTDEKAPPKGSIPPANVSGGKPHPYKAASMSTGDKAFGDMGVDPPYEPKTDTSKLETKPTMPKSEKGVPQAESLISNKSLISVTQLMSELNDKVVDYDIPSITVGRDKFHPNPLEAVEYVAYLVGENRNLLDVFLRILKKRGVKLMEAIAPPIGFEGDETEAEVLKKKKPDLGDFEDEEEETPAEDEFGAEDEEDPDDGFGAGDEEDEFGGEEEAPEDEMGPPEMERPRRHKNRKRGFGPEIEGPGMGAGPEMA